MKQKNVISKFDIIRTLCVQIAFGVNARLTNANVRCSDEVAVNFDVFRFDDDE